MARFKIDAVNRSGQRTTYEFDLPVGVELTHLRVNANGYLIHNSGVAHRLQSVHHGAYDLSSLREVEVANATPIIQEVEVCLLYTSPSPRDATLSRMPSSA